MIDGRYEASRRLLVGYQWLAGLCDLSTGVLLLAAPAFTLRLLFVHVLPAPLAFARFIGVFVGCIGASYLWVGLRWPFSANMPPASSARWQLQWQLTAGVRTAVALFLLAEVLSGALEAAWLTVALSDAAFAAVQCVGLRKAWLPRG